MANETFTVTVPRTYTFREGWGATFMPVWTEREDGSDYVSEADHYVVRLAADSVFTSGNVPCVVADDGRRLPVENFRELDELDTDDTHDLRDRWFATEQEAREHARYTVNRFDRPRVWESFVAF